MPGRFKEVLAIYAGHPLLLATNIVIVVCVGAVFMSILINFLESRYSGEVEKGRRSVVDTASMTAFFLVFYLIVRSNVLTIKDLPVEIKNILLVLGLLVIAVGSAFNIIGRVFLGRNWANQIHIYKDQTLVSRGPYRVVRHPLYASIIWMFFGACLVYLNVLAFLAATLVFVPFMYYRAKQEESMLTERFPEYRDYRRKTGMFFPKIVRR